MATTVTFYVPTPLKKARVVAADYEQSDAIAFCLDDHPNRAWETTNSAEQYIEIDTNYSSNHPTVDAYGVFIRNYLTDWGGTYGTKIRLIYKYFQ